jgi:hypothetical protein
MRADLLEEALTCCVSTFCVFNFRPWFIFVVCGAGALFLFVVLGAGALFLFVVTNREVFGNIYTFLFRPAELANCRAQLNQAREATERATQPLSDERSG